MTDSEHSPKPVSGKLFLIFLLGGLALAFWSGYAGFDWPGVFASAGIIGLGYVLVRAKQIRASGRYLLGEFLITTLVWSMFTAIVYYLGSLF